MLKRHKIFYMIMFYEIRINVDGLIWWLETSSVNEAFFYGVVKSQFLMQPPKWWLSMHAIYAMEKQPTQVM